MSEGANTASAEIAESKATRAELAIETAGAFFAAFVIIPFYWSGDELAPLLASAIQALTAIVEGVVSFLPNLAKLSLPDWHVTLVTLSAATTTPLFRIARETGHVAPAASILGRIGQYLAGALCLLIASYSLLGLAIFAVVYVILRAALAFYLNPRFSKHPDEMDGAVSNAMGSFYFIFMTLVFVAAFYVVNALLLGRID